MNPVDEESFEQEIASSEVGNSWLDISVTKCPPFNLSFFFLQTVNLGKHWHLLPFIFHRIKKFSINLGDPYEKC